RRQAALLESDPLPLIIMTPKSLLRNARVASSLHDLAEGHWQPVIHQPSPDPANVRRLLLCSGKIYVDLQTAFECGMKTPAVAIASLEQIYPFPMDIIKPIYDQYTNLDEIVWIQ